ncbi:hypothetical protein ACF08W_09160 [Streptomyces sp. NPDC015144]|uniref:hypothetical protein n=1 Tax=Streptomyces sp. NPDC015144 TaxID=3364944 RepID=UPI0037035658
MARARKGLALVGVVAVVSALVAGCGGGGGGDAKPAVGKALAQGVEKRCGHYLKAETVATALGDNDFDQAVGGFKDGKGSCVVFVSAVEAGYGTDGPHRTAAKVSLEILDWERRVGSDDYAGEHCRDTTAAGVTKTFRGPGKICVVYRADPPDAFLVGGRLQANADEGTALLTVTVDGVDHALEQDREHALQLLAEARAVVRARHAKA